MTTTNNQAFHLFIILGAVIGEVFCNFPQGNFYCPSLTMGGDLIQM